MEKASGDIISAIIIASIILVVIVVFVLLFFLLFIKKRAQLKQQNENLKVAFQQELLQTQIEIQEETFAYISEEIHDNTGQVLSFLKLNLSLNKTLEPSELEEKIRSSQELVTEVIKDLRNLSKSLSYEFIKEFGLADTIKSELDKISQSKTLEVNFLKNGKAFSFSDQFNLLIFRIFQESINNIIKHASASKLEVSLNYKNRFLELQIKDNGLGFDINEAKAKRGSGLINIQKRAKLLNATLDISSIQNQGSIISLQVPYHSINGKN